jgi:hypothetical protein
MANVHKMVPNQAIKLFNPSHAVFGQVSGVQRVRSVLKSQNTDAICAEYMPVTNRQHVQHAYLRTFSKLKTSQMSLSVEMTTERTSERF